MTIDQKAPTDPPPAMPASPDTELLIKHIKELGANVTLIGNAVKMHGELLEGMAADLKDIHRQVHGAAEASASAIDISSEAKTEARTLHAIVEDIEKVASNANAKAGIAMDIWTQAAGPLGVRDIVDKVEQEHADAQTRIQRPSSGPPRR